MTTYFPAKNPADQQWRLVDADGKVLGRMAAHVAHMLMGKHKPTYTPFIDHGDPVIVINAAKVELTGQKLDKKVYRHHTGFPGGLVERRAAHVKATRPDRMVREAIEGMLPKNKLGKAMARKLHVYIGDKHPHDSQKPAPAPARFAGSRA
jgi:large subunit ribosomal protein L13